jgi:hypothetical protein
MPRPRKNDPTSLLAPIVEQFTERLAATVERFTIDRVEAAIRDHARGLRGRGGRRGLGRGRRAQVLCYYPGCKNIAAPRFGMFCAALHKNLPKAEKEKYRAQKLGQQHKGNKAGKPAGRRGRKKG